MGATQNSCLPDFETLSRTNINHQDIVLCKSLKTESYMTGLLDRKTRTVIAQRFFQTAYAAYQDYFTRISVPLALDRQKLSLLLTTPESELQNMLNKHDPTPALKTQIKQQGRRPSDRVPITNPDRSLTPASFATPGRIPEWLEATRNTTLLNAELSIRKGEQYKLLAMELKPNTRETESSIHLATPQGKRATISLATACSCFQRGTDPHTQH